MRFREYHYHRPAPLRSCLNVLVALSDVGTEATAEDIVHAFRNDPKPYSLGHVKATLLSLAYYGHATRQRRGTTATGHYYGYRITAEGRGAIKLLASAENDQATHAFCRQLFPRWYKRNDPSPKMPSLQHIEQAQRLARAWDN